MGKWWVWGVERGHKTQRQCGWWGGEPVGVGQGCIWHTRVSNPPEVLWKVWGSESQGPPPPHHALTHGATVPALSHEWKHSSRRNFHYMPGLQGQGECQQPTPLLATMGGGWGWSRGGGAVRSGPMGGDPGVGGGVGRALCAVEGCGREGQGRSITPVNTPGAWVVVGGVKKKT